MTFTKPLLNFILIWQWHCLLSEFRRCSFSFFLSFNCAAARSPCQSSIKCHIAVKTISCTELHLLLEILGSQSIARVKMYICIQKLHLLGLLFPMRLKSFFFFSFIIFYHCIPVFYDSNLSNLHIVKRKVICPNTLLKKKALQ